MRENDASHVRLLPDVDDIGRRRVVVERVVQHAPDPANAQLAMLLLHELRHAGDELVCDRIVDEQIHAPGVANELVALDGKVSKKAKSNLEEFEKMEGVTGAEVGEVLGGMELGRLRGEKKESVEEMMDEVVRTMPEPTPKDSDKYSNRDSRIFFENLFF